MKVGILTAISEEFAPLLLKIESPREIRYAVRDFYEGEIAGIPVCAVWGGVCKVNAALSATLLIEKFGCDAVIFCGVAGGMDKALHIGDVILSNRCVYHDVDESILTGVAIPHFETPYIPSAKRLTEAGQAVKEKFSHMNISFGTIATGEQFIDEAGRDMINHVFSPKVVDMESAAAAHAAYCLGVDFIAVRTVSDSDSERGFDVFLKNVDKCAKISADITEAIIKAL